MPLDAESVRAEAKADFEAALAEIADLQAKRDEINKAIKAKRSVAAEKERIYKAMQPRKKKSDGEEVEASEAELADGEEIVDPVAVETLAERPEVAEPPAFDDSDGTESKQARPAAFTPPDS